MKITPAPSTPNTDVDLENDNEIEADCLCFHSQNCNRKEVIRFNCKQLALYILSLILAAIIILLIVVQTIVYSNNSYTRLEQYYILLSVTIIMECILIPPIIISICIKKTIWPVILVNIVFLCIQVLLLANLLFSHTPFITT